MAPSHGLIPEIDIWRTSGMIIPAIMTLICFICTAVSITVSGFICLRDREAQDETDNKSRHHKQQEFISKALGLFYKIRTSNIFRIQEIMQDLNDERPVWIGSKQEIVHNLEYYGIFPTENEKSKLLSSSEVFEIDCESLFYFELERFSKAQAVYGGNVLKYFECIQQDGSSFPREFYPDAKAVFQIEIIYNVFTEMQILTELFVLLSTGIDLEIINIYSIPPQFKHSKLGDELSKIKDFLYNYYKRVFPTKRSSANVMRKLPQLPIVYEPIFEMTDEPIPKSKKAMREAEGSGGGRSGSEADSPAESPTHVVKSPSRDVEPSYEVGDDELKDVTVIPSMGMDIFDSPSMVGSPQIGDPWNRTKPGYFQSKGRRITATLSKRRMKIVSVYKTLAERLKQRSHITGEQIVEEPSSYMREDSSIGEPEYTTFAQRRAESGQSGITTPTYDIPGTSGRDAPILKQIHSDSGPKTLPPKGNVKSKKDKRKAGVTSERSRHPAISEKMKREKLLDIMRRRYKAPPRAESNPRRRGRLARIINLDHNAFTYMVTRVLGFLQEKGAITQEELNSEKYRCIDKSFIV